MNAIATVNQGAPLAVPQLPPSLVSVLEQIHFERPRWSEFPVISPEQRQLVPAAIEAVERTLAPASREQIIAGLGTIEIALPMRKNTSEEEAEARLEIYVRALSDIPADIFNDACVEAVKQLKFFPKVAELREFAAPELGRRKWRLAMLRQMARVHDEKYTPPVPPQEMVRPEDLARLAKRLGSTLTAKSRAKAA